MAKACPRPQHLPEVSVVSRRLDRGRLCAADLTKALGWAPHTPLSAEIVGAGLVRLRPDPRPDRGPVPGSSQAHVDANGRIAVPVGLRKRLGVGFNGMVLAVFDHGVVEVIAPVLAVEALRALADTTPIDLPPLAATA